jgi:gluconolactonase
MIQPRFGFLSKAHVTKLQVLLVFVAVGSAFGNALSGAEYPGLPITVAEGANLEAIHREGCFFEGPTWDSGSQRLFFTSFGKDEFDTSIRVWDPSDMSTRLWADKTEGTNGTLLTAEGTLLGAQHLRHRLVEYDLGDKTSTSPRRTVPWLNEPKLNQPNDLTQDKDGFIYFSDPDFANRKNSGVYRFVRGHGPERLPGNLELPNGLEVTQDGRLLVVADSASKKWYSYDLKIGQRTDDISPPKIFFDPGIDGSGKAGEGTPDGMAIDDEGNFYLTGTGGIWCVRRNGESIGFIPVPEFVSNVCFGGPDGKWLYATCQDVVYRLKMKVGGCIVGPLNRWNNAEQFSSQLLRHTTYPSKSMGTEVGFSYWLPPDYESRKDQRYPVLYWLHGLGGSELGDSYPATSLASKVASGEVPPMILIQLNAGARSVYADSFDGKWLAETTVISELIPFVDQNYRTIANRSGRALQGMSMGGEGAIRFAVKYPELFSSAIGYAGGYVSHSVLQQYRPRIYREMFNDDPAYFEQFMTQTYVRKRPETNVELPAIRLICGTADDSIDLQRQIDFLGKKVGWPIESIEVPGVGHNCIELAKRENSDDLEWAIKHFRNN